MNQDTHGDRSEESSIPVSRRALLRGVTATGATGALAGCLGTFEREYEATPGTIPEETASEHNLDPNPEVNKRSGTITQGLGVATLEAEVVGYTTTYKYIGESEDTVGPSEEPDSSPSQSPTPTSTPSPTSVPETLPTPTESQTTPSGDEDDGDDDDRQSSQSPTPAEVTLTDKEFQRTEEGFVAVVDRVRLDQGGFVVLHKASNPSGLVLGVSRYLEPGEHFNVRVRLDDAVIGDITLVAMAHKDNGNAAYDAGSDQPYTKNGEPITDTATLTATAAGENEQLASIDFSDKTLQRTEDGFVAIVDRARLDQGGFVVLHKGTHSGAVFGNSKYLEPGEHFNVRVRLDESISGDVTLVAMAHKDNGNAAYDAGSDQPYTKNGEPITDSAVLQLPAGAVIGSVEPDTLNINSTPNPNFVGQSLNPAATKSIENLIEEETEAFEQACNCTIEDPQQIEVKSVDPAEAQLTEDDIGQTVFHFDKESEVLSDIPKSTELLGTEKPVELFLVPSSGEKENTVKTNLVAATKSTGQLEPGGNEAVVASYISNNIHFTPQPLMAGVDVVSIDASQAALGTPTPTQTPTSTATPEADQGDDGATSVASEELSGDKLQTLLTVSQLRQTIEQLVGVCPDVTGGRPSEEDTPTPTESPTPTPTKTPTPAPTPYPTPTPYSTPPRTPVSSFTVTGDGCKTQIDIIFESSKCPDGITDVYIEARVTNPEGGIITLNAQPMQDGDHGNCGTPPVEFDCPRRAHLATGCCEEDVTIQLRVDTCDPCPDVDCIIEPAKKTNNC